MVESEIIVKIYLPEKDNQLITLKCSPDTTIEDITDSLENYLKLDPSRQTCFFRLPNFDRELKPHIQLDKIKQDSQGTIILHAFIGRQLTNTLMQTTLLAQTMLNQTTSGIKQLLMSYWLLICRNWWGITTNPNFFENEYRYNDPWCHCWWG